MSKRNAAERRSTEMQAACDAAADFMARVMFLEAAMDRRARGTPKENGAVRRASMDLTRALADLRRNRWHEWDPEKDA